MALLFNAPASNLGEYRTLPQIDTVALLLAHGSNDSAHEHPIRRRRLADRTTRISKRRLVHRYWTSHPKASGCETRYRRVSSQRESSRPAEYGGRAAVQHGGRCGGRVAGFDGGISGRSAGGG